MWCPFENLNRTPVWDVPSTDIFQENEAINIDLLVHMGGPGIEATVLLFTTALAAVTDPSTADTHAIMDNSDRFTIDFSTLELNHWIGETPLLYIMDTFHTPNCMQTIHNDHNLVDTHWPFQQDYPPSLLELTSTATHSTSFCLAFSVNLQQRISLKTYIHIVLNSSSTYTTPTRNIPGARILC